MTLVRDVLPQVIVLRPYAQCPGPRPLQVKLNLLTLVISQLLRDIFDEKLELSLFLIAEAFLVSHPEAILHLSAGSDDPKWLQMALLISLRVFGELGARRRL